MCSDQADDGMWECWAFGPSAPVVVFESCCRFFRYLLILTFFKPIDSSAIAISLLFPSADSSCLWNQFACSKNKCIAKQWLCDGENDCEDGLDESVEICG